MTITDRNGIINALANSSTRVLIDKASLPNTAAGQLFSLWQATGSPGAGATPSTAAICTSALAGAIAFPNQTGPATSYHGLQAVAGSNSAITVELHDRLAHMGGLSGTSTSAQGGLTLTGLSAARRGASDYSGVQWWLEVYTALGATGVNATVAVTYNDDTTGNLAAIALGATPRAGRAYPLVSAVAGKYIKAVNSVTLSATTGTAGNFGITATRTVSVMPAPTANKAESYDWAALGLTEIPNDACLMLLTLCSTTTTGTVRGFGKILHG